jgi:hypothetical protein
MKKVVQFGETVKGYDIPVLNEREIRAAAGLLFLFIATALILIIVNNDFRMAKYAITFFLTDFLIRVFVSPRYSPTLIMGRLIVRSQTPEYVGAKQKRFAWMVGVALSAIMFIFLVVINAYSPITGLICLACLVFLFFESAFGICLACRFYAFWFKEKAQYCPGEVCDIKSRHPIQKTSRAQVLVVLAFFIYAIGTIYLFSGFYGRKPYDLFGLGSNSKTAASK